MKNEVLETNSVAAAIQRAQDVLVVEARDISPHRSTTPSRRRSGRAKARREEEEDQHEPRSPLYYSSGNSSHKKKKDRQQQSQALRNTVEGNSPTRSSNHSAQTPKTGSLCEQRDDVISVDESIPLIPGPSLSSENRPKMEEVSRLHQLIAHEKMKRKSQSGKQRRKGLKSIPSIPTDSSVADASDMLSVCHAASKSVATANQSVTSNLLYQALRTGNSSTLSQATKSVGKLNRTLSEASDNFHDFHNPNIKYDSEEDAEHRTNSQEEKQAPSLPNSTRRSIGPKPQPSVASTSSQRLRTLSEATTTTHLTEKLPTTKSTRSYDSSEEMTYYRYVAKHTILQLCTEDLMSDNWKLVDYALYRLGEACCCHTDNAGELKVAASNRIRFIKAGGHAFLAGVMKKYAHSPDIQISSSRLIHQISQLDREDNSFAELFASVNGLECVVNAIVRYPEHAAVHPCACAALTALVCGSAKMVRRLMQDPNHLKIYFGAMKAESTKNQMGTCRVLYLLSSQQGYCKDIVDSGGIEAIALEMKNHCKDKVVQIFGCWALANIAEHEKACAVAMREVGALAIGVAMKAYPKEEKVQEKAVLAFFHISLLASQQIKKAGGLSSLGSALENFPQSEEIQQYGSATIKRLLESNS